jgi:enamine deaminase RidA (YjgF/YER057c/UK114 family)
MNKVYNPDAIAAPVSTYSHAVEVPAGARTLHVAGQIGVKPDGSVAEGVEAQAEQAWRNVIAILADAGMGVEDLVRANTFVTRPEDVQVTRDVRNRFLGDRRPASTLLVVAALAAPAYLFELEVVAAKV